MIADFAPNSANLLGVATIGAHAITQNTSAHGIAGHAFDDGVQFIGVYVTNRLHLGHHFIFKRVDDSAALGLFQFLVNRLLHTAANGIAHFLIKLGIGAKFLVI